MIEVRVSPRAPRQGAPSLPRATPPLTRAQNLVTALLEGVIGQLAEYVENSPAVERLVRAQTARVLRELAHDAQVSVLIRSYAEQYVAELTAHPEILEPLVRVQVDRYLEYLAQDSEKVQAIMKKAQAAEPKARPVKPRKRDISLE